MPNVSDAARRPGAGKKPSSLRATLAAVTIVLAFVALLVCGALVVLTTILHKTTASIGTSVESVRLAEGARSTSCSTNARATRS